jgi:hypothetical protein
MDVTKTVLYKLNRNSSIDIIADSEQHLVQIPAYLGLNIHSTKNGRTMEMHS